MVSHQQTFWNRLTPSFLPSVPWVLVRLMCGGAVCMPSQQKMIVQISSEEHRMLLNHDRFLFALSSTYGVVVGPLKHSIAFVICIKCVSYIASQLPQIRSVKTTQKLNCVFQGHIGKENITSWQGMDGRGFPLSTSKHLSWHLLLEDGTLSRLEELLCM